jgi:carbonic anhydrase
MPDLSRRRVLAGTWRIGALAALGGSGVRASRAATPAPDTPEAALAALTAGNRRYVGAQAGACMQNLAHLLPATENRQSPFAAVLSCADSRVPVEQVFDHGIGDLFVTRVAGNIATPEIIASLEYGVAALGTKAIVVLGHASCGAVAATMARKAVPGQISALYAYIRPAVEHAGGDLGKAIRLNAAMQADLLAQSSPVLAEAIAAGTLAIAPAYYDLQTGQVSWVKS